MYKNNRFTNKTSIGRTQKPLTNYEFSAGFPETASKIDKKPKNDLNYLQTPKVDKD